MNIHSLFINTLKIVSSLLITGAVVLDSLTIYLRVNSQKIPDLLIYLIIMGSLALIIHFVEGIIAVFVAQRKGLNPIKYGIYTFLVGSIGLWELLEEK